MPKTKKKNEEKTDPELQGTSQVLFRMDSDTKKKFKAKCVSNNITIQDALISFIDNFLLND